MFSIGEGANAITQMFFDWFKTLFYGYSSAASWLLTPVLDMGSIVISPLYLLGFAGIVVYIQLAVAKWLLK